VGKQVNFFMHPDDLAEFDAWLRNRDETVVLADCSQTPMPQLLSSVSIGRMGEESLRVFLVRSTDLPNVISRSIPNRGYLIDGLRSPVVEFSRCYFDDKLLRRGRLYYDPGFWDEKKQWKTKVAAFSRWADAILRRIRSAYKTKQSSSYVGPSATKWAKENNGELAQP
jgi:hypothetical protein